MYEKYATTVKRCKHIQHFIYVLLKNAVSYVCRKIYAVPKREIPQNKKIYSFLALRYRADIPVQLSEYSLTHLTIYGRNIYADTHYADTHFVVYIHEYTHGTFVSKSRRNLRTEIKHNYPCFLKNILTYFKLTDESKDCVKTLIYMSYR